MQKNTDHFYEFKIVVCRHCGPRLLNCKIYLFYALHFVTKNVVTLQAKKLLCVSYMYGRSMEKGMEVSREYLILKYDQK